MAVRPSRTVLSMHGVTLPERQFASSPTKLDLELPRRSVTFIQVDDESDASALVDLCLGMTDPSAGHVRFLGVDWASRTPRERMFRRRRIGAVMQTDVWPAHMTVLDSVLVAGSYHFKQTRAEMLAHATELARLFALPGLPTGRRETTPRRALVRAACVRGFLGSPDLIIVQDGVLEQATELAVPMAQAISSARDRGGAILWIATSLTAAAAEFVEAEQVLRLGEQGLVRARRGR
jgi:phospholipid/cholesterol/gamma-HCH transport system ATP-binding protein